MSLNCVKLGHAVTLTKDLASAVSLIFLPKTLIWNKITFPVSNLLNFGELLKSELMKNISKKIYKIFLFVSNLLLLIVRILRAYN